MTKVPYQTSGVPASSTDPNTWNTHQEVEKYKKIYSGIGVVIPLDNTILAIDIDKCLDEKKNITNPPFISFVEKSNTYTEISPSQKGIHLFFFIRGGVSLSAHRSSKMPGFECYSSGRYMTYTGIPFGKEKEIREITQDEADNILSLVGYPWKNEEQKNNKKTIATILPDSEITQRMFNSKNGAKIRSLWDGDISQHNNDDSAADMALCMYLSFWTQKNTERIRSLWLFSPLGQRKKTQDRKDYQDMTISHAISATQDVYTPYAEEEFVSSFSLMTNKKKVPFANSENILRIISKDELLSASFRYNGFSNSEETNLMSDQWREIEKRDIGFCMLHIQRTYPNFEKITREIVDVAIAVFCTQNIVNPPKEWITSLEWDGEHRLDHWLSRVYGVKDDEYHSSVGANWMKGLVKRVVNPGCKFDFILILEGPQGWKKSESLYTLGNGYHVETILSPDNKDFFMLMGRNIIVEFSEGHTMNRSDTRLLKSVVTMKEDQYRVPYGRGIIRFPRHCVFAMTTNESAYLRDETGNRRFLPVEAQKVADIEWLENNLDQLYAEAYKRVIQDKETIWEFPDNIQEIQQSKMIENPYAEKLVNWYLSKSKSGRTENGVTALEAYRAVWQDDVPLGREMSIVNAMQVTTLFTTVLKLKKRQAMRGGVVANRWFPTEKTPEEKESAYSPAEEFANF